MLTKLIIKNYIPLLKKGVSHVELDTNDILNILLGRNGFGKTSLLKELTVLPPDNADYAQGGYKEIHYVDGKNTYVLQSTTGKSSKHYFYYNGKNLNEGNTLLVQKELVKIHFKVTNFIKNVLTGLDVRDLFTTLSPLKRKEFLMAVNPNDTSYGLDKFNKFKNNLNTIKGALKSQRQRLVVEEERLSQLVNMDPKVLNHEIKQIDEQIKNAILIHGQLMGHAHTDIIPIKKEISSIVTSLLSNDFRILGTENYYVNNIETIESNLSHCDRKETQLTTMLIEITNQLNGFDSTTNNLEKYDELLNTTKAQIAAKKKEIESIRKRYEEHSLFDMVLGNSDFYRIADELINFIRDVDRAVDMDITSQKYVDMKNRYTEKEVEHNNVKNNIREFEHALQHYNKAGSVECPDCNKTFKLGFEKFDPVDMQKRLDGLLAMEVKQAANLKVIKDYLEDNERWYETMKSLVKYAQRSEYGNFILKVVSEYRVGKSDTSVLISLINSTVKIDELEKDIVDLEREENTVSVQVEFLRTTDMSELFKRAEYAEQELGYVQRYKSKLITELRDSNAQLEIIRYDDQLRDRLEILYAELKEKVESNGLYTIKTRVEEVINELTPKKDLMITNLIRAESLNSVIDSIKENIADLEKREKHTTLLMDGLSPVKGMIGFYMSDFLKSVIANMNAIIQPIWTTQLQILNCGLDEEGEGEDVDLSYLFPVLTGDSLLPGKDVSTCSGGEREIINFAFRLVILRYQAERGGVPLMMDEVGVAFDELHRGRFCAYMDEQMRLDKLPQTFMVSHYINQYGMFNNSNVIALNTDGLSVPTTVNQKSVIR